MGKRLRLGLMVATVICALIAREDQTMMLKTATAAVWVATLAIGTALWLSTPTPGILGVTAAWLLH